MSPCRACPTPYKPHNQVSKIDGEPLSDPTMYRNIVDALQYLTFTRPDLSYPVNSVLSAYDSPTNAHFHLVKRILRYVQGTLDYGISFTGGSCDLTAYSDEDWQETSIQRDQLLDL
ncbi:hypothetical protein L3X38_005224 [Prunus dulcis]|uniref:Transposable element protein n=1 Tax=Prunus dulcis TaxID=3755 RepID=A0AAD4ZQG3_PRUDU|nr:hypothetical protein L3X38_005224 [Prunus dulcis]